MKNPVFVIIGGALSGSFSCFVYEFISKNVSDI